VIVGSDRTFGKGSVQVLNPLRRDLGGMKVTTALYFLPGGKSTQKSGVEADVQLPLWFSLKDVGENSLDYPLPAQEITPFLGNPGKASLWKPVEQPLLAKLAANSKFRVMKNAKFAEIIKNNKEAADKKDVIRLADLRKEMKKNGGGEKNETPAELKKKAREQNAPFVKESVNVLLDMVMLGSSPSALQALHTRAGGVVGR
jgi:carboxyl-terminal processing protease